MNLKVLYFSLLFFSTVFAQTKQQLQKSITEWGNSIYLQHAQWALYAQDVDQTVPLLDLNGEKSMAPASGLKLFTTAAATELLGPDFQFETRLYFDGTINQNGILTGNIYVRGGGDPTLGSDNVPGSLDLDQLMRSWLQAIRANGIREIDGSIIADDALFQDSSIPSDWLWTDMGNYYGTGVSALTINDNLYQLFFKPGLYTGARAEVLRTEPEMSGLKFKNLMLTGKQGSGDNGYIYKAPNSDFATLRGTIPAGVKEFSIKGALTDPALFTAAYLAKYLREDGIVLSAMPARAKIKIDYSKLKLIHSTISPPLSEIIAVLNKRSVNLYAEQLLFMLAVDSCGLGTRQAGIDRISGFLKQNHIDISAIHLEDGSGLSPNDLISAKMMVQMLSKMKTKKNFDLFYKSMSLAGDKNDIGYFKNFGRNSIIEKKCRIKSGLIQGVRSHSGYLTTQSGRLIAFSLIANHLTVPASKIDRIHEALLIRLAELY